MWKLIWKWSDSMGNYVKGETYKITFANLKGGVGKSTSSAALAYILGQLGFKVLAVDTDSQCNLTTLFDRNPEEIDLSINEIMLEKNDINECIIPDVEENVDLIASSPALSILDMKIVSQFRREFILEDAFKKLNKKYDFIIFDTPPALNITTLNVFICSDAIIVPSEADILSLKAIDSLNDAVRMMSKVHDIKILGILLTRVERLRGDRIMMENSLKLGELLNTKVFNTYIRAQKNVKESRLNNTNVVKYSIENRRKDKEDAGLDYERFAEELLNDLGVDINGKV